MPLTRTVYGRRSDFPTAPLEIMTAQEVADFLRLEARTVTSLALKRVIPGRRFGKLWRFSRRAIVDLVYDPEHAQAVSERELGADGDSFRSDLVHTLHPAHWQPASPAHRAQEPVPHPGKGFK